jgi:hypothetical protein
MADDVVCERPATRAAPVAEVRACPVCILRLCLFVQEHCVR